MSTNDAIMTIYNTFQQKLDAGILALEADHKIERKKKSYDHLAVLKDSVKFSPTSSCVNLAIGEGHTTLVGKCARSLYFSYNGIPESNPSSPENLAKMKMGNAIETQRQEYLVKSGYMSGTNTRYLVKMAEDCFLSIETDGTIKDEKIGNSVWECKSTYEKGAREVFGSKTQPGHPRWEYCIQMMTYLIGLSGKYPIYTLDDKQELVEEEPLRPVFCINENIDRAAGLTKTFIVFVMIETPTGLQIASSDDICTADPMMLMPGWHDREHDRIDYIDIRFGTVHQNAYSRGLVLNKTELPARDSAYQYSDAQIEYMFLTKLISKTKYEEWKKQGMPIGDYQCRYCNWKDLCLGNTPWVAATVPNDELVLTRAKRSKEAEDAKKEAEAEKGAAQ